MKGMSLIVKTVTRWVKVFIFLFGVYITITGHLGPGGGFAGGVIIACSFVLLMLAYGKEFADQRLGMHTAAGLDSIGALIFLAVAVIGLGAATGSIFFINYIQKNNPGEDFALLSSGTIPISNIGIGIKVGASLFSVFIILAVLRIVNRDDGTKLMKQEEEEE